jgi:hypothetical protein
MGSQFPGCPQGDATIGAAHLPNKALFHFFLTASLVKGFNNKYGYGNTHQLGADIGVRAGNHFAQIQLALIFEKVAGDSYYQRQQQHELGCSLNVNP